MSDVRKKKYRSFIQIDQNIEIQHKCISRGNCALAKDSGGDGLPPWIDRERRQMREIIYWIKNVFIELKNHFICQS